MSNNSSTTKPLLFLIVVICAAVLKFQETNGSAVPPDFWAGFLNRSVSETLDYIIKHNLTNELNFEVVLEEESGGSAASGALTPKDIKILKHLTELRELTGKTHGIVDTLNLLNNLTDIPVIRNRRNQDVPSNYEEELMRWRNRGKPLVDTSTSTSTESPSTSTNPPSTEEPSTPKSKQPSIDPAVAESLNDFENSISKMIDEFINDGQQLTASKVSGVVDEWVKFGDIISTALHSVDPKNKTVKSSLKVLKKSWSELDSNVESALTALYNEIVSEQNVRPVTSEVTF